MGAFRYRQQQTGLVYDLLPPERSADDRPRSRFEHKPDIVDAEFVTVLPAKAGGFSPRAFNAGRKPPIARPGTASPVPAAAAFCLRAIERWLQRASARTFAALVASLFVLVFGLAGGFSGLSGRPATAAAAPLQFSHVTLTPREANGMPILVVNGIIENDTGATAAVPPIRADLVSNDRLLASIVVTPPIDRINAGESRGFMARLQHPGGKMPELRLSFLPQGVSGS